MNDYKELIEQLNGACIVKVVMKDMVKADLFARAADAIERLVKERDAAVEGLYNEADYYGDLCYFCAKNNDSPCIKCEWEWRGVREDNT